MIADEISNEILQMPQFPESIINLQRELSDPNCTFATISDTVNSDPSLAAEILRIANSPVYMVRNKINDVSEAVRLIGMLGVKSVLYNYGVNQVFNKQYDKKIIQEINDHSFYVALIASYLARYKKLGRLSEDIYMAALLHDMGKIIVKALNRDLEEKLEKICREKHIPVSILDDLTDGYNHSLIGAEVAGKWNFPDKYISAIAYHHRPLEAEEEYKVLVYSVYLANEVYYFNKGERDRSDLNFTVLSFFGLENKDAFDDFINSLINEGLGA
jgi:putative nucleotidyltransferase with HDIG domain